MTSPFKTRIAKLTERIEELEPPVLHALDDDFEPSLPLVRKHFQAAAISMPGVIAEQYDEQYALNMARRMGHATTLMHQATNLRSLLVAMQMKILDMRTGQPADQQWLQQTTAETLEYADRKKTLWEESQGGYQFITQLPKKFKNLDETFQAAVVMQTFGEFDKMNTHEMLTTLVALHTDIAEHSFRYADTLLDMTEINLGLLATPARPKGDLLKTRKESLEILMERADQNLITGTQHDNHARRALPPAFRQSLN